MSQPKDRNRRPDFRLRVFDKKTAKGTVVGAAWAGENGEIQVVLDPCVVLKKSERYSYHLFPADAKPAKTVKEADRVE